MRSRTTLMPLRMKSEVCNLCWKKRWLDYFGKWNILVFLLFFCRRSRKTLFLGKRKSYLSQWRERSCLRVSFLFLSIFDKGQWQAWFSRQQLQKQIFPLDNIGNILLAMIEVVVLLFCLWLWQPACKRCVCIEVKREICYSFIFLSSEMWATRYCLRMAMGKIHFRAYIDMHSSDGVAAASREKAIPNLIVHTTFSRCASGVYAFVTDSA